MGAELLGYWASKEIVSAMLKMVSELAPRHPHERILHILFPSLSFRSSGGWWSCVPLLFPGVGGLNNSSAGPRLGADAVNHTSEIGSCRTWARCLLGNTARRGWPDAVVDLARWRIRARVRMGGLCAHRDARTGQGAAVGSLRIGREIICAEEAFLRFN